MNKLIISLALLLSNAVFLKAQTGVNTRTPNASSILEVNSTSKGVLLPRLNITTLTNKTPVTATIADGLLAYNSGATNTNSQTLYYWDVLANPAGAWMKQLYFKETPKVAVIGLISNKTVLDNADGGIGVYLVTGATNNFKIINSGYMPGLSFYFSAGAWNIMVGAGTYTLEISYLLSAPTPDVGRATVLQAGYYNMGYFSDLWISPYNPNTNTFDANLPLNRVEGATISKIDELHRVRMLHTFEVTTPGRTFAFSPIIGRRDGSGFLDKANIIASGTIIKLTKLR